MASLTEGKKMEENTMKKRRRMFWMLNQRVASLTLPVIPL